MIRADPGLISEPDHRALSLGPGPDRRVLLFLPSPHRLATSLLADRPVRPGAAGDRPIRASSRPTHTPTTDTNSRRTSSRAISLVHSVNSNCSCRGSVPTIRLHSFRICSGASRGGPPRHRPGQQRPRPPSRYFASHAYTVLRCRPRASATSSGCASCCTWSTARSRSASSVLWSSLRPSWSRMLDYPGPNGPGRLTYELLGNDRLSRRL